VVGMLRFMQQVQTKPGKLVGLIENNSQNGIDNPITERLLKMFDNITLTIVQLPGQTIQHLPALTAVRTRIL